MANEMVLDDPGVVDADAVGEFDLLDHVAIVRLRVAHGGQIGRQIEQAEFHGAFPYSTRRPALVQEYGSVVLFRYFFAAASSAS